MRRPLALALLLSACSRAPEPKPPPPVKHERTEPIEPGAPLNTAQIDLAKVQLDLAMVRARITEYQQVNEGKNPPSIAALGVRLSFPAELIYDPANGTVKSKTYPAF